MRKGLGSPHLDSRAGGALDAEQARVLARPDLSARVSDIDHAGAVLVVETELVDESPILDLRVRKAARRNGAKVVTLTSRPSTLDPNAAAAVRFAPGAAEAALAALAAELGSPRADGSRLGDARRRASLEPPICAPPPRCCASAGDVVILWGERVAARRAAARGRGRAAGRGRRAGPGAAGPSRADRGARRRQRARPARGGRAAATWARAWRTRPSRAWRPPRSPAALADGDLSTLVLLDADPLSTHPERAAGRRRSRRAGAVIAFADFLTPALTEHATVVFPAESNAEKEGTLTHPDGRLQRVRQAIGHQGEIAARSGACWPSWRDRCGAGAGRASARRWPTAALAGAVPFCAGLDLEEIGGRACAGRTATRRPSCPRPSCPTPRWSAPPELPEGLRLGAGALAVGRRGDRARAVAALPRARAAGRAGARPTPSGSAWQSGDEVRGERRATQSVRGHGGAAPGGAARQRLPAWPAPPRTTPRR